MNLASNLLFKIAIRTPAREISAMENWIAQDVDAIIVSAVDAKALETYVEQAHEKRYPGNRCHSRS